MASFRIHEDQENGTSILPTKAKGNVAPFQKRSVLGIVNRNTENVTDSHGANNKEIALKKNGGLKVRDDTHMATKVTQKQKSKIVNESNVCQNGVIDFKIFTEQFEDTLPGLSEKVSLKQENKSRILKDKPIESQKPCSSREVDFPSCITALPKEPSVSSNTSAEPMSEADDIILDSPMCIDTSKTESALKCRQTQSAAQLTLTERLYACHEYRTEIFMYLRTLQYEHRPRKSYMLKQPDISNAMRAILVDWLVEVVEEYKMKTETLYLAVSYIDRFLSYMSVVRTKLQLVGTAAMFIASKFEEIYPPDVKDFVFITDDSYTKKQVLRMEHLILKVLSFDLSTPTTLCFLANFSTSYPTPDTVLYLAMYLCELTLLEADPYLGFLPSEIAAAALCVARHTLLNGQEIFPEKLQEAVDHHIEDFLPCVAALDRTFRNAETNPQRAVPDKYKADKFNRVSTLEPLNEDCHHVLTQFYGLDQPDSEDTSSR